MNSKKRYLTYGTTGLLITCLAVSVLQLPVLAQRNGGNIICGNSDTWWDTLRCKVFEVIEVIGAFLVSVIYRTTGVELSDMVMLLGYLSVWTLFFLAIEIIRGAKKILWFIIWFIILAGWGLIAVRVVMHVLQANPA